MTTIQIGVAGSASTSWSACYSWYLAHIVVQLSSVDNPEPFLPIGAIHCNQELFKAVCDS